MKKLIIDTNIGTFAAYTRTSGEISIYQGDDNAVAATIEPFIKRKAALDLSSDGIYQRVRDWLETNHDRIEIERVTVHIVPNHH